MLMMKPILHFFKPVVGPLLSFMVPGELGGGKSEQ